MDIEPQWPCLIGRLLVFPALLALLPVPSSSANDLFPLRSSPGQESISLLNEFQDLSLKMVFRTQSNNADPLKSILSRAPETQTLSVLMKTALLSGRVSGEGEVSESRPAGQAVHDSGNSWQHRLIRFGLTGIQDSLKYGASYRVAGEGVASLQDHATREVWGEWNVGMIRLRTAVTERWNNVDRDPHRPRFSGTQRKTTLAIVQPAWPELTVTYARDSLRSFLEPIGIAAQRNLMDTVEAALSYARSKWTARLFSTYSIHNDRLRADGKTVSLAHALVGSYRAGERVMIAPTVSVRADQQRWSGVRLQTPSASLMLTYFPSALFKMTAFGSFSKTRSSDGLVDSSMSKMTSVFTWVCRDAPKFYTTLSFDASYTAWLDTIQPGNSTEDLSGLLRLQIAGL